ncbi:MAG TPA: DMT family transporter [Candidatus Acidoferrales bacterium]|jgi:drug/metabolite transporter (DMT)-like permease|nr:DMT family transporter [Candidatus Acidoferrales bacterium]
MMSQRVRADLAFGLCTLIWGATFALVKDALADISVVLYIAVRFALSAALMAIIFWSSLRRLNLKAVWAGAQIGVAMFAGYIFQTAGLKYTTPAKAAFITGMCVVIVPLLLAAFGRRRITAWIWAGAATALAGLYFLTVPPAGFGALNRGDPIVFGCAVMFALHIILIGRYVAEHSVGALAFLQVATTAVLSTLAVPLVAFAGWEKPHIVWNTTVIVAILVTSVGSTVIGFSLQTWAQQHTSPSHTAILVTLEPVFAALTSWIFALEHFGARTLIGAALILVGILLAELKGPAPTIPESPEPIAGTFE